MQHRSNLLYLLCLTLVSLLFIPVSAQNYAEYEFAQHPEVVSRLTIAASDGGNVGYAAGYVRDFTFPNSIHEPYMLKFGPTGNVLWTKRWAPISMRIHEPTVIDMDTEGRPVIGGFIMGCDYGTNQGFIEKLNKDGTQRWRREFQGATWDTSYNFFAIKALNNGNTAAAFHEFVLLLDSNGTTISMQPYNMGWIWSLSETDQGNLVIGAQNGTAIVSQAGQPMFSQSYPGSVHEIFYYPLFIPGGGDIFMFSHSGGKFYKADATLNVVDSLELSNYGNYTRSIFPGGTNFYAITDSLVVRIDNSLNVLSSFPVPKGAEDFNGGEGAYMDSLILLVGNQNGAMAAKAFHHINPTYSVEPDVSVVATRTTNFSQTGNIFNYDAHVTIQNAGTTTLESVGIRLNLDHSVICGRYYVLDTFSGLSLAPGDTVQFTFPNIADQMFPFPDLPNYAIEVCATAPNGKIDGHVADNCLELYLTGPNVVTATTAPTSQRPLRIWPNPVQDLLRVDLPKPFSAALPYSVYDLQGKTVRQGKLQAQSCQIPVAGLPDGTYCLRIGVQTVKFVKQ